MRAVLALSGRVAHAAACALLVSVAGCNLFADAVPCRVDDNCAVGERCLESACVAVKPPRRDAGLPPDAGGEDEDAGLPDGGPPPPCSPEIVVTAGTAAVPQGQPVRLSLDHAALVSLGFAPDGSDLHLVYDDGVAPARLPRALDPLSSWNTGETTLWFPLAAALEPGASTSAYRLEQDASSAPNAEEAQVFPAADFFERPDETPLAAPWSVPHGGVAVRGGALEIDATNGDNRPLVELALPAQASAFDLVLGWAFTRTEVENEYRLHLHLGNAAVMPEPLEDGAHFANDGASVSVVWGGVNETLPAEETIAADVSGGYTPLEVVSGRHEVVLRTDPTTDRYDVLVDGEMIGGTLPFLVAGDVIDRFRVVAWRIGGAVGERRFEYVYLLPRLAQPPTLAVELPATCQ